MKPGFSSDTVQRALSAHAAVGLIAGALLYLVCLTGTLAVFYEEWQRAEQPHVPEMMAAAPEAVQSAVTRVLEGERAAGKAPSSHLYVHLPVEALPRTTITTDTQAVHVDSGGGLAGPEEIAWSDFLFALHYSLNLPGLIGLIVVGALGVMMLALSVTGALAHPRIFRDAFRFRARSPGGVGLADWHNRLSVWTLPFGIAIALTGAVIGLATLTGYGLAARYHGGDIEAVYAPVFGGEGMPDKRAAGVPEVAAPLRYMAEHHPDIVPSYVVVHDPMTAGQHVQIVGIHANRLIFGEYYQFDAAGTFHGTAGMADGKLGQQIAASNYDLHFGNYGGLPVKIAYFVFGLAATAVVATGTWIWLGKRRRRGLDEPRLHAGWDAVVWGMPLAIAVSLLTRLWLGNAAPLAAIFWVTAALLIAIAAILGRQWPSRAVRAVLAATTGACLITALAM